MNRLGLIGEVFKPAAELIDNLHTSEKERLEQKAKLWDVQTVVLQSALEHEQEALKAKAAIIHAEAQSESWIARNWRPITMLTFLTLIVGDSMGWLVNEVNERMWLLLEIGLGGYVVGRSAEKITKSIIEAKVTGK